MCFVVDQVGAVDVLVNNAGYGLFGAAEEVSDAEAHRLMDTNFFAPLHLSRAVLPGMRVKRQRMIVNFSSIAGITGFPGCGIYCASKFALEGLSESMALELAPLGIKVMLVEPGGFRTNFSGSSKVFASQSLPDYQDTPATQTRQLISSYVGQEPGDPAKAAEAVIRAVNADSPPMRLVLGEDALHMARAKLQTLSKNYDDWATVTCSTNLR
jgi:NAD(P)-dependent dehydrogenase (short-subunit alcohol dehydrogenase family)